MIDTLVIARNRTIFNEINKHFHASSHNFEYTESVEGALDFLESEAPDFIFIVENDFDKTLKILDKLKNIEVNESFTKICFTGDLTNEQRISLFKSGSLDVIRLPILQDEFKMLYEKYCNSFRNGKDKLGSIMQGKLEDFNIIELIQSLEDGKKTAVLKLKRTGDSGQIFIKDGQIFSAEYRQFKGMTAILNLIGWIRGDFYIEFVKAEFEREVEQDNQDILMEAVHRIDERASFLKQLPPVDDILLIAPNLDLQKLQDEDLKYIKFFHGGNTTYQFLLNFTLDDLKLLDIAVKFYSKKMLLTREQFDAFITEYEAEVEKGGILGFFSNMFKKNGKSKEAQSRADKRRRDKTQIINPNLDDQIRESVVLIDPDELNEFKEKITEL